MPKEGLRKYFREGVQLSNRILRVELRSSVFEGSNFGQPQQNQHNGSDADEKAQGNEAAHNPGSTLFFPMPF